MLTKEKRPLDFHRASIGPRSISFLFEKSTPLRAPFPRLLPPFSFPKRFATSNFSSPHNSSFTDHFSATSHQPCSPPPRATSRFVSFLPPYPLHSSIQKLHHSSLQREGFFFLFSFPFEYFHEDPRRIRNSSASRS